MKSAQWFRVGIAFCIFASAVAGCSRARPVRDKEGAVLPGSISYHEQVYLNGTRQWIYVRGVNRNNPVVLWLDGGPGKSEVGPVRRSLEQLHKTFTIVCWDQRGFGRSAGDPRELRTVKVSDYVQDTIALSELLRKRFNQSTIYLVGHDWGSVIGLAAASQRPDLYAAVVGVSPRVNTLETDRRLYTTVIENARRAGDTTIAGRLKEQGPPPYNVRQTGRYALLFREAPNYMPRFYVGEPDLREHYAAEEHSLLDRTAGPVGVRGGYDFVYPQLAELDMETQVSSVDCPVFFVVGRHDYITPLDITQRYFTKLDAPAKDLVLFDRSAHSPCFSEPERFISYMNETVLAQSK